MYNVVMILVACISLALFDCRPSNAQQPQSSVKDASAEKYLSDLFNNKKGVSSEDVQRKWLDIPYATLSPAENLDIYLPNEGNGPFPVILAIHGGSFSRGDKRDFPIVPIMNALHRGYAVELEDAGMGNPDQPSAVGAVVDWYGRIVSRNTIRPGRRRGV
jgi:acetyl esterase/lipase